MMWCLRRGKCDTLKNQLHATYTCGYQVLQTHIDTKVKMQMGDRQAVGHQYPRTLILSYVRCESHQNLASHHYSGGSIPCKLIKDMLWWAVVQSAHHATFLGPQVTPQSGVLVNFGHLVNLFHRVEGQNVL